MSPQPGEPILGHGWLQSRGRSFSWMSTLHGQPVLVYVETVNLFMVPGGPQDHKVYSDKLNQWIIEGVSICQKMLNSLFSDIFHHLQWRGHWFQLSSQMLNCAKCQNPHLWVPEQQLEAHCSNESLSWYMWRLLETWSWFLEAPSKVQMSSQMSETFQLFR